MSVPPHPYSIQPWGNLLLGGSPSRRAPGLGYLDALSDELLCSLLFLLDARSLARLGLASRFMYTLAHHEEFWKAMVLEECPGDWEWRGTWRETYLVAAGCGYTPGSHVPRPQPGCYSDLLHQPWACAHTPLDPAWLELDNIDRVSGLTPAEFQARYEVPNRPVVLTDVVPTWPAATSWDRQHLAAALAGQQVLVGNTPLRFKAFCDYCDANTDEMPLYLFDKHFALKAPYLAAEYSPPAVFGEDLFALLGEEDRPDYRWLILGGPRSGSTWHVDPNATSAWNAVLAGSKKWLLYPPGVTPPGVHPSPDGADVAAPVSLMEWFLSFYDATREGKVKPVEAIVRAGELLFVPRGWWHTALNLEPDTLAVTHNYVSPASLPAVLDWLASRRPDLVSGCATTQQRCDLYDRFVNKLQQHRPDLWAQHLERRQAQAAARQAAAALAASLRTGDSSFCFGFSLAAPLGDPSPQDAEDVGATTATTAAAAAEAVRNGNHVCDDTSTSPCTTCSGPAGAPPAPAEAAAQVTSTSVSDKHNQQQQQQQGQQQQGQQQDQKTQQQQQRSRQQQHRLQQEQQEQQQQDQPSPAGRTRRSGRTKDSTQQQRQQQQTPASKRLRS